jgi:hypothetical protein
MLRNAFRREKAKGFAEIQHSELLNEGAQLVDKINNIK